MASVAESLKVLAHPYRLKIVEILEEAGEAPVHDIVDALGAPQAAVSGHLNKMRRAGLIAAERKGKEGWYRIADPHSLIILDCIRKKVGEQ